MEPDFSGYVTKANLKCTDGRTIAAGAFAHQDGAQVPLMYQHKHDQLPLGHVILTKKEDGIWGDCYLNESSRALDARAAVKHKDLNKFSVWARELDEQVDLKGKQVLVHDGIIQEVSLVLAGANPGAIISNVLAHDVNGVTLDPEEDLLAVTGEIMHSEGGAPKEEPVVEPVVEPVTEPVVEPVVEPVTKEIESDVLDSLTPEQRLEVNKFIDELVPELVSEALAESPEFQHSNLSGRENNMSRRNLWKTGEGGALGSLIEAGPGDFLHSHQQDILVQAKGNPEQGVRGINENRMIGSLREFVRDSNNKELLHADDYGIQNIEILFPDAKALMAQPTFIDRRQEWVKVFLNGTGHTPFSRVKTRYADLTADEARARGWIKGNRKNEEVFPIFQRTTGPDWVYKKQALDRQDIIDIVDFDVVAWMKVEMRGKLDEELARAALFGDGRPTMIGGNMNPDKIKDPQGPDGNGIRSIVNDDDLYAYTVSVPLAADATGLAWNVLMDASIEADEDYRGSGNKTGFISFRTATRLLTMRDAHDSKRLYRNLDEVAGDMGLNRLVKVPTELFPTDVLCIALDLSDYNFGTNQGGEVTLFDDFDIHFNKFYYLMETYLSGALVSPYAAIIFKRVDPTGTEVEDIPAPTKVDNVVTIPTSSEVAYRVVNGDGTFTAKAGGSTITLNETNQKTVSIEATPKTGFYFPTGADTKDTFNFRFSQPST